MTMHLLGPQFNNIGRTKKKPSVKQQKAHAEHQAWLRSQNLHPDQLAAKPKAKPATLKKVVTVDTSGPQCTNGFSAGGAKKSVFDTQWQRTYENDPAMAEREKLALEQAQARKSQLMPLYNKGPIQLNTGLKMTELGKRR